MNRSPKARRLVLKRTLLHSVFFCGFIVCAASACNSGPQSTTTPSSADGQAVDYGPLAVLPPSDFRSFAGGVTGQIRIDDNCVTVDTWDAPEGLALLVWHSEEVTWDDEEQVITYKSSVKPSATPVSIKDGDVYQFGGHGPVGHVTFLSAPHPACQGIRVIVDFVEFMDYGPLAVVAPSASRSFAGGLEGPIRILDNCVILDAEQGQAVLVFHAEEIRWSQEGLPIIYWRTTPSASLITIRDGDIFRFRGSLDPQEGLDFIASPRPECPARRLLVDGVELPGP